MLGNFPQAFTHLALVNTASVLSGDPRLSPGRSVAARADGDGDASTLEEPPASLPE
jgi:hypothetical protein